jgi:hypothetical protein
MIDRTALTRAMDWPIAIALLAIGAVFRLRGWLSPPLAQTPLVRPGGLGDLICLDMAASDIGGLQPLYFVEKRSVVWAATRHLPHVRYDANALRTLWRHAGRYRAVIVTEQRYAAALAYGWALKARGGRLTAFATQRLAALADATAPYDPVAGQEPVWFRALIDAARGVDATFADAARRLPRRRRAAPSSGEVWVGVSGAGVPSRTFDADAWVAMTRALDGGAPVRVACQPSDRALAEEIVAKLPRATLFSGDFASLCEHVARAERVITVDGGFAHIAAAMGAPVTAIFTAGVAAKWKPYAEGSVALVGDIDLPCRPCTRWGLVPPCPIGFACKAPLPRGALRPAQDAA